jgi:hypothetical protein
MNTVAHLSRPTLSAALETWKKTLAERGHATNVIWIFEENLCIERSRLDKGGFHFGFQTKFSAIPDDALEIAYDQFCLTDAPIVFYRLGGVPRHSICMLLCDPWFEGRGESEGFIPHDESRLSFHPGQDDHIEEVTDLTRWLRRVRRDRNLHPLDFGMSLATIDEIILYGRPLMPYERFTSRMVGRLRQILRPAA